MWGAFTTKDKAIWAAKNNKDFFSEGRYYEYVVVEKYALNCLLQTSEEIMWYDLTLEKVIEKPECFDRIVDFAFC